MGNIETLSSSSETLPSFLGGASTLDLGGVQRQTRNSDGLGKKKTMVLLRLCWMPFQCPTAQEQRNKGFLRVQLMGRT